VLSRSSCRLRLPNARTGRDLLMTSDAGQPHASATQQEYAGGPWKEHRSGVVCALDPSPSRLSFQTAPERLARNPRYSFPRTKDRHVCSRLFLARTQLPPWKSSIHQSRFLATENHRKSGSRQPRAKAIAKSRMEGLNRLGV